MTPPRVELHPRLNPSESEEPLTIRIETFDTFLFEGVGSLDDPKKNVLIET